MAYIGKTPVIGNFVKLDAITAVNGQAAYTMQNGGSNFTDYESVNQFLVSLNGTIQAPTDSFTVSGSTLTFASNLSTGDVIDFVMVFGNSLSAGTPTDATVTNAKISYPLAESGATVSTFNRTSSDGTILELQKDGTKSADIGTVAGGIAFISGGVSTGTGLQLNNSANQIRPCDNTGAARDNAVTLGDATRRWQDLYLGGGLYVGGTGTANKLDDYEEGTWTPSITGATGVTNLSGSYRKVGSLVTIWVHMLNGNIGGSPSYTITGLPFTIDEVRSTTSSIASYNAFASNATSVLGLLAISSTQIDFLYNNNGSAWSVQNINTDANVYLHFSASYIAN